MCCSYNRYLSTEENKQYNYQWFPSFICILWCARLKYLVVATRKCPQDIVIKQRGVSDVSAYYPTVYLPKSMNATLGRITNSLYLCDHVTSLTIIPECSLLCVELYSYWNDDEINVPYNRLSHNILRGLAISRLEIIAQHDFGVTKLSFLVYAVWGLCLINHVIESMPIRLLSVFITATLGNL